PFVPPPAPDESPASLPADGGRWTVDSDAKSFPSTVHRPPSAEELPPLSLVVAGAYGTGLALFALRWLVGLARLRRLCHSATPVPPWVAALFDGVAGRAGRRVRLLMTDRLDLPLTFGWRAPVILLPVA